MQNLTVGRLTFVWGSRTYVMGILNVTPDSFSGDSVPPEGSNWVDRAVARAEQFFGDGADLVDVGGESTRPGSAPVAAEEEIRRVVPVIERLAGEGLGPLSIDTWKAEVARSALEAGAAIVNDVTSLHGDTSLGKVAAEYDAPIILMHNRSRSGAFVTDPTLGAAYLGAEYVNLLADVQRELMESVTMAREAGVPDHHIVLDPGIGFGKSVAQNLELIDRTDTLRKLGYPVLVGPSRKSFIGKVLGLPANERVEGTAAAVAVAIARGADMVRVHDVHAIVRVARMTDALVRRG